MANLLTAAIVGLGSRGRRVYGEYALNSTGIKITAAADISPERLEEAAGAFGIRRENLFESAEALTSAKRLADWLFICTPDNDHYATAVAALNKGYNLLLEKPVATTPEECTHIARLANENGLNVVVCHVLRYTPFYSEIKRIIDSGRIGEVVTVQAVENVGYYHHAHSFVRGNWRDTRTSCPMILAKCCHDTDILLWLTGRRAVTVSSFGGLFHFKADKAPNGAAERCLSGCKAKAACPYDAEKIYLTSPKTGVCAGHTGWPTDVVANPAAPESVRAALEEGPYGRCVYRCDNDAVDHQVVNIQMDDGSTASLTMAAFSSEINRRIRVMGTLGEIDGDMGRGSVITTVFGQEPVISDINETAGETGHGGGDGRMMDALLSSAANPENVLTTVERSLESHMVCFAAERSRVNGGVCVAV